MTKNQERAIEQIKIQARRAADLATELERYAREMADTKEISVHERMAWAINDIENYLRNINFATLARYMSKLTETALA